MLVRWGEGREGGSGDVDIGSYQWYYFGMGVAKVAISLDRELLQKLDSLVRGNAFSSRSAFVQVALVEKLSRLERSRLAEECSKLSPMEEQSIADESLFTDLSEWPEY